MSAIEVKQNTKGNAIREIGNLVNVKYTLGERGKVKAIAPNEILATPEYKGFKEKCPNVCRIIEEYQ